MLHLDGIRKTYRGTSGPIHVLNGVTLAVAAGEFIAVCGASGCGKSTLLLAAGGLLAPDEGTVLLDGQNVYALPPGKRARLRAECVGFVFQQFHLVPYLTARDNVLAAGVGWPADHPARRADELLEAVGLADRASHVPAQLSVGERQRSAFARALLNRPGLLLADEPTGNLDPAAAVGIVDHLVGFARGGGAVLLVTHDPDVARSADRVVWLEQGRLREGAAA